MFSKTISEAFGSMPDELNDNGWTVKVIDNAPMPIENTHKKIEVEPDYRFTREVQTANGHYVETLWVGGKHVFYRVLEAGVDAPVFVIPFYHEDTINYNTLEPVDPGDQIFLRIRSFITMCLFLFLSAL